MVFFLYNFLLTHTYEDNLLSGLNIILIPENKKPERIQF